MGRVTIQAPGHCPPRLLAGPDYLVLGQAASASRPRDHPASPDHRHSWVGRLGEPLWDHGISERLLLVGPNHLFPSGQEGQPSPFRPLVMAPALRGPKRQGQSCRAQKHAQSLPDQKRASSGRSSEFNSPRLFHRGLHFGTTDVDSTKAHANKRKYIQHIAT